MTNGSFWQRRRAEARAEGLEVEMDRVRERMESYRRALEAIAARVCDGCKAAGRDQCSHASAARLALDVAREPQLRKTDERALDPAAAEAAAEKLRALARETRKRSKDK